MGRNYKDTDRCPPRDPRRSARRPAAWGRSPSWPPELCNFLGAKKLLREGRAGRRGESCTPAVAELWVAKNRSQLSRAGSPPKKSQPQPTPHLDPANPRTRRPGVVRGRAPAGTTWARSEAESGRAAAAVGPGSLGVRPDLDGREPEPSWQIRTRLGAWQSRGFGFHIPQTGLRPWRSGRRRSRQGGRRGSPTVP